MTPTPSRDELLDWPTVSVDLDRRVLRRHDGAEHPLSNRECALLRYLARHADRVVSREELLREVWGLGSGAATRACDSSVFRLRSKLEVDPSAPEILLSVFGGGYRLWLPGEPAGVTTPARVAGARILSLADRSVDLGRATVDGPTGATPLTANEVALLEALAEAGGASVDRDTLQRRVWGSTAGRALKHTVSRLRRKLEADPTAPTVLVTTAEGYRLDGGALSADGLPGVVWAPLPAVDGELVGRDAVVAEIARALADGARSALVLGLGGVGKSRVAHAVARRLSGEGWRATRLDLTPIHDTTGLLTGLARILGLRTSGPPDPSEVGDALDRAGPAVLVLDDAEHLAEPVADLVGSLVANTSVARVLVTSRVPVPHLERRWHLRPLDPSDAVALFRATAPRPILPEEAEPLAGLVADLDGHPLAVRLAAPWVLRSSVPELRRKLDHARLALLRGKDGVPGRHDSVRAVLEGSLAGVSEAARATLAALTVFAGGCTHEAAVAVERAAVQDVLHELADASLLEADEEWGRWTMPGVVRELVAERLGSVARQAAEGAHAAHFADVATRLDEVPPVSAVLALARDLRDLELAARRAIRRGDVEIAARCAVGVAVVHEQLGPFSGAIRLLEVTAGAGPTPGTAARVALALAAAHLRTASFTQALDAADRALALATDPIQRARALVTRGGALAGLHRLEASERDLEAAAALARESGAGPLEARALVALGRTMRRRDRRAEATATFERAARLASPAADPRTVAEAHCELGAMASFEGRPADAEAHHRIAITSAEDAGDRHVLGRVQMNRVWELCARDRPAARLRLAELSAWFRELGAREEALWCLAQDVTLALQLGAFVEAERVLETAERLAARGVSARIAHELVRLRGVTCRKLGRREEAAGHLERAAAMAAERGDDRAVWSVETERASSLLEIGAVEAAVQAWRNALAAARRASAPAFEAESLLKLGQTERAAGHPQDAETHLREALGVSARASLPRIRAAAALELARLLAPTARTAEARELLGVAREALTGLNAPELEAELGALGTCLDPPR